MQTRRYQPLLPALVGPVRPEAWLSIVLERLLVRITSHSGGLARALSEASLTWTVRYRQAACAGGGIRVPLSITLLDTVNATLTT